MPLISSRQVMFTCTKNCQSKASAHVQSHLPASREPHDQTTLHLSLEKQRQLGQAFHNSAGTERK